MTSTAIYTCYRQLHPPTGVDHAVFGSITAPGSRDLVVGKASILELYKVHRQGRTSNNTDTKEGATGPAGAVGGAASAVKADSDDAATFYLELAGTFPLAGNISALAVLPVAATGATATTTPSRASGFSSSKHPQHHSNNTVTGPDTDAAATATMPGAATTAETQDILVVSFGAAQMALVAYDAGLGRLTTLSIHNFDADAIGPGSGGVEARYSVASALKDRPATISACDPAGRCLAAVVAGYQLVVLPTLQYVPRSVFLSEEARERARRLKQRKTDKKVRLQQQQLSAEEPKTTKTQNGASHGVALAAPSNGTAAAEGQRGKGDVVGEDRPVAGDAFGGAAGEQGVGSKGEREAAGELANGGSRVAGAHWAVSKPFTVDLEEAGVTG